MLDALDPVERRIGLDSNHPHTSAVLLQPARRTHQRAGRTHAAQKMGDASPTRIAELGLRHQCRPARATYPAQ